MNCKFYAGDWESFSDLWHDNDTFNKFDYIFTSETIYNTDNYQKICNIFKKVLKENGVMYPLLDMLLLMYSYFLSFEYWYSNFDILCFCFSFYI